MLLKINVLKYALLEFALCKRLVCAKANVNLRKCMLVSWHSRELHVNNKELINAVMILLAVDLKKYSI